MVGEIAIRGNEAATATPQKPAPPARIHDHATDQTGRCPAADRGASRDMVAYRPHIHSGQRSLEALIQVSSGLDMLKLGQGIAKGIDDRGFPSKMVRLLHHAFKRPQQREIESPILGVH